MTGRNCKVNNFLKIISFIYVNISFIFLNISLKFLFLKLYDTHNFTILWFDWILKKKIIGGYNYKVVIKSYDLNTIWVLRTTPNNLVCYLKFESADKKKTISHKNLISECKQKANKSEIIAGWCVNYILNVVMADSSK